MNWVFCDISMWKLANSMNSTCFWPQNTLPVSCLQWSWREWETIEGGNKNYSAFLPGVSEIGSVVEMSVFLLQWSGSYLVTGYLHLALLVPRVGATPESSKPDCSFVILNRVQWSCSHHGREHFWCCVFLILQCSEGKFKNRQCTSISWCHPWVTA
jgi:hypothetical protein